jgi:hypothetical protein
MRSDDILSFVQRQPFQPFRLTLTDGRTYEINHPELAMVGRSTVAIGIPGQGESGPVYDRLVTVSLLHIMQAEPLDTASAS